MGIFKKLGNLFSGAPSQADRALYLYVQCDRCGEKLKARVDLWNEITPEFDGKSEEAISYHCRKVLIGENRCYNPIELRLRFDKNHKLVEKEIYGGKFIDKEEFEQPK
jgi:hypothetical protein